MKHHPERNLRLRASRFAIVAMTLLCLAALFVPTLSAQKAPAGAVIGNQATATYLDASSVSRTAFSNLVQTTVSQQYTATFTTTPQTKYATPGTTVYFPHTFTNTGNGPDSVTFTAPATSGNLSNITVYLDANGDGIPDNTTPLTAAQPIASSGVIKIVVAATLTAGSPSGGNFNVTATSGAGAITNTDNVILSNNGVIAVTKSMTQTAGVITVNLNYTNTGNNTAINVTLADALNTAGFFAYVPGSAKWNGVAITDVVNPPAAGGGLTWGIYTATSNLSAVVLSVAPGVTGTLSYNVTANTPTSYPATYTNTATYTYTDQPTGGTTIGPYNTNTVAFQYAGWDFAQFTAGPGFGGSTTTFVASTDSPVLPSTASTTHTTTGTDTITAPTTWAQGSTIYWSETVTNAGVLTDTFNLTLCTSGTCTPALANPFPTGTVFQLYRADGKTPLTDTNSDGIVDSGPLLGNGTATIVVAATLPPGTTIGTATQYSLDLIATPTNSTGTNFGAAGIADTNQLLVTVKTTNATVDVAANSADTVGNGTGVSGESVAPAYSGNPGTTIAVPFWIFTTNAPDVYNLSFMYNGVANVGNLGSSLTPFTSAQAGSVPAASGNIPAWTVLIAPTTSATCATYGAPVTASSVIAAGSNAEYCLLLQVPASYAANTYHFTIQAQSSSTGAIDQMAVKAQVKAYDFVSINPNNQAQIYAGGTVVYRHVVTNGGNVTETGVQLLAPSVPATPAGWTATAYYDVGALGQFTNAASQLTYPYTVPSLAPGASATYFIVVQAPSSANPGDQQVLTWSMSFAADPSNANLSVTDTSTVVNGQIKLLKGVKLDPGCNIASGTWSTLNYPTTVQSAASQTCVIYQIQATNTGTTPITSLSITDAAPPYTTINGSVLEYVPATGCTGLSTGTVTTSGSTFAAPFTGSAPPNCVAAVYFEVKLN
jgi:hypothetical protein